MSTKLIGLDTSSSKSGYSIFINGEYMNSGVIDWHTEKNSDIRLHKMCISLLYVLNQEQPNIVVAEMTAVTRNASAQRMLTMILGVIYGWCIVHNVEFVMLRPTEWRALISKEKKGRKREELKAWSIKTVKEKYGLEVSDDEADSILIGQSLINKRDKGANGI